MPPRYATATSQATKFNGTEVNKSAITEDMKQGTDYAQVLVSCSKCDTTCMHGWHGSIQGKDQQLTLKPQMKLRGSIDDAHKICEDALVMLLYFFVTMIADSCATTANP